MIPTTFTLQRITPRRQTPRIAVRDVRVMGRNTQGVRLMNLDAGDTLVAVKRVPQLGRAKIDGAVEGTALSAGGTGGVLAIALSLFPMGRGKTGNAVYSFGRIGAVRSGTGHNELLRDS